MIRQYLLPEELKIGDKIKCISHESKYIYDINCFLKIGKIYTVKKIIKLSPHVSIFTYGYKNNPLLEGGISAWFGTFIYVDPPTKAVKTYGIDRWLKKYAKI